MQTIAQSHESEAKIRVVLTDAARQRQSSAVVTLCAKAMTVEQILHYLARFANCPYALRKGAVVLGRRPRNTSAQNVVALHDVADLLASLPFAATRPFIPDIRERITRFVSPESWSVEVEAIAHAS